MEIEKAAISVDESLHWYVTHERIETIVPRLSFLMTKDLH